MRRFLRWLFGHTHLLIRQQRVRLDRIQGRRISFIQATIEERAYCGTCGKEFFDWHPTIGPIDISYAEDLAISPEKWKELRAGGVVYVDCSE